MGRCLAGLGFVVVWAALLSAEEVRPVEGSLTIGEHTYKLAHIVVYEVKTDDGKRMSLIASDRKIPVAKIKESLEENYGSDDSLFLSQPFIRISFNADNAPDSCSGWADNSSFSSSGDSLSGELSVADGRAKGFAKLPPNDEGIFKKDFDLRFDVAIGLDVAAKPLAKPTGPVKASVSGTFKGNGKAAKLAFVSARPGEPFDGEPSIELIFTEKDHSKAKQPSLKASFGDFGSALIISLHEDGSIFGCQVSHAAHPMRGFSAVGQIKTTAFEVLDGQVSGTITTDGEDDFFNQTWEVADLTFVAPYKPAAAAAAPATDKPVAGKTKAKMKASPEEPAAKPEEPAAAAINVHDLPYPKDASDFQYKQLVGYVDFKSGTAVKTLAADLAKKLDEQGWKKSGPDLIGPNSSIIKRERGEASLTIFVKPDGKGSTVKMMTEGLDWAEKPEN